MNDETVKIQFELPLAKVKEIDALMSLTGVTTRKDYFNNALALLEWAIREKYLGNNIASVNEQQKKFKELVMPILSHAAKAAK